MADYFERLVRRTLGQVDVARPDLAPRFATATPAERVESSSADSASEPPSTSMRAARVDPDPSDLRARRDDRIDDTAGRSAMPATTGGEGRPRREPGLRDEIRLSIGLIDPWPGAASPSTEVVPRPVARRLAPYVPEWPTPTSQRSMIPVREPDTWGEDRPSTVKITIGRVDVRAMPAAAVTPSRQSAPRSSPLRSLQTYLDERNGRRS